jgi:hypothetical protein
MMRKRIRTRKEKALNNMANEPGNFPEEHIESGVLIDAARRTPSHCLYCMDPADGWEHGLTEVVGGRLAAYVLCKPHNGIVNDAVDKRFNANFAPLVNMLQIRRQRGTTGAEFVATDDDGKPVVILAQGFAKQQRMDVQKRDENGKILYAEGDLDHLDKLPVAALSPNGRNLVLAKISNPAANFVVGVDETLTPAILKIALHFFASFVGDVPLNIATELLKTISGELAPDGGIVRTPYLHDDVFSDSWPARHELTAYPEGDHTLVTVLLFSAYAFTVRLPVAMKVEGGVRYTQVLTENFPRFETDVPRPASLDWDDRPGKHDAEKYYAPIKERNRRIYDHGTEQAYRARCKRAYETALTASSNYGDIWERYAMRLQLECFEAYEVRQIVGIGQRLSREGKSPWEIPVVNEAPPRPGVSRGR